MERPFHDSCLRRSLECLGGDVQTSVHARHWLSPCASATSGNTPPFPWPVTGTASSEMGIGPQSCSAGMNNRAQAPNSGGNRSTDTDPDTSQVRGVSGSGGENPARCKTREVATHNFERKQSDLRFAHSHAVHLGLFIACVSTDAVNIHTCLYKPWQFSRAAVR